ncbi:MAG: general secretion pathway protein GspK [Phycisphaeraceae bacterium]|nr:general secretion pathway protein GspK [Phycisphaeraceae bacterium]
MMVHKHKTSGFNQQGMVLVAVLWTAILLMLIVGSVVRYSRLDMKLSVFSSQSIRCKWASRAGVETVAAILNEDSRVSDSLDDLWSDNEDELVDVPLSGAAFTALVIDEAGKLNINVATQSQLLALPDMTEEIADAILDWRDRDDSPKEKGVEVGYYRNLSYPYECRNGPFKTIRELLLVKGVNKTLFYGEDTNLNGELDYNEQDGDTSLPLDNSDDILDQGWIAFLSCYSKDDNKKSNGEDRVNVNSASLDDLQQNLGLSKSYAQWIVDNRNDGFKSIGDLLTDNSSDSPEQSDDDQARPIDVQTFRNIVDDITVSQGNSQAKVNVNTAPKEVLVALLEARDGSEMTASSIVASRQNQLSGIQSIGDLLDVPGLSRSEFKKMVDWVTVRSNVFTVYSRARALQTAISGATVVTEAVLDRTESPCQIAYWYQGASY